MVGLKKLAKVGKKAVAGALILGMLNSGPDYSLRRVPDNATVKLKTELYTRIEKTKNIKTEITKLEEMSNPTSKDIEALNKLLLPKKQVACYDSLKKKVIIKEMLWFRGKNQKQAYEILKKEIEFGNIWSSDKVQGAYGTLYKALYNYKKHKDLIFKKVNEINKILIEKNSKNYLVLMNFNKRPVLYLHDDLVNRNRILFSDTTIRLSKKH